MNAVKPAATQTRKCSRARAASWLCLLSLVVGAAATVGISWMGALDEAYPSPIGLARYRYSFDPMYFGRSESREERPAALAWWDALTPRAWQVGPRVWPDFRSDTDSAANPELCGEGEDDLHRGWCVTWRAGPGLSDSFSVRRCAFGASAAAATNELERADLNNYFYSGDDERMLSSLPVGLIGRGTPNCTSFSVETHGLWEALRLPQWAMLIDAAPRRMTRLDLKEGESDPDAAARSNWFGVGQITEEVRAYGWPLRCLIVHGWRRDLEWYDEASWAEGETNEWWSDGLGGISPLRRSSSQLDLPATGLPWKPVWLPFLANSLILGLPLTLAGLGVSRAARWGFATVRRRGGRCANCGYPREGLAGNAACPECGSARG